MRADWIQITTIWLLVAFATVVALGGADNPPSWFGAILAGAIASVALIHLFKASPDGIVRKLVYVGGGSYLILAAATLVYLFSGWL